MKKRLPWILIAFVAVVLGILSCDRITLWQHHLEYLRHCPEVRLPDSCTDVSYGFWGNIWRIPEEARRPIDENQGQRSILYSFVWLTCASVAAKSEEELLKEFESRLVTNGWHMKPDAWTPEGLPKYGIGLEGLFDSKESAGRRARFDWGETKGSVHSGASLLVACWRDKDKLRIKVVGVRSEFTPLFAM
jgi:hypothetical protein